MTIGAHVLRYVGDGNRKNDCEPQHGSQSKLQSKSRLPGLHGISLRNDRQNCFRNNTILSHYSLAIGVRFETIGD